MNDGFPVTDSPYGETGVERRRSELDEMFTSQRTGTR